MGKYETKFNTGDTRDTINVLGDIANELAEANRLKRVELDLKIMMAVDPGLVTNFLYKNEDLA